MKQRIAILFVIGFAAVGLSLAAWSGALVMAQAEIDESWTLPVNLSHSGAATDPVVIRDSDGRVHALWLDSLDGFAYSRGDATAWTPPVAVEVPFFTRRYYPDLLARQPTPRFVPGLIAGRDGRVFAFWQDDEASLFVSSVPADEFTIYDAWSEREVLSELVPHYDMSAGPDGRLHLLYIQTFHSELSPAGVYYRQWDDDELAWSEPVPLYESIYFRLLESGDANLAVAAGGDGRVDVAWDDPRLGVILLAQSQDDGATWSEPIEIVSLTEYEAEVEVESPADEPESQVLTLMSQMLGLESTSAGGLHLVWQISGAEVCDLYYQFSADGGSSWDEPQNFANGQCGSAKQVLLAEGGELLVLLEGVAGGKLLAWDGAIWSEPYLLPDEFEDSETGRAVVLGCVQLLMLDGDRLMVVGCDRAGGGEIWMLAQEQGSSAAGLFVTPTPIPTSVWGAPVDVALGAAESPRIARSPSMVADAEIEGRFHLIWSQPAKNDPDGPGREIVYARWDVLDQERFPRPVILFTSQEAKADQPALAADAGGRLHLVWSGNQVGEIMYSRAEAESAFNPSNWGDPQLLPMLHPSGSRPQIAIGRDGVIHVVYVVALNEGRSVFHTFSTDGGDNWSEPTTIGDGVEAGWPMVEHPTLAIGGDGVIHVAWSIFPLQGSLLPSAIYTARSSDGGATWSEPFEVADGAVDWPQLAAVGALEVHLVYAETAGREVPQHRWSADGGQTWTRSNWIPALTGFSGPVKLVIDEAGRIHLVAVSVPDETADSDDDHLLLYHQIWVGERWIELDAGPARVLEGITPLSSISGVAAGDRLGLTLAGSRLAESEDEDDGEDMTVGLMALLSRSLELPAVMPTPLPTLTPTPTPLPQPTATPTMSPTPTPDLSGDTSADVQVGPVSLPGSWVGLVLGAVPAAILVVFSLLVVWAVRWIRRGTSLSS